jgi:hypothetical protein
MNVSVVGLDSVFCKAFLGDQVMEKELFGRIKFL